MATTATTARARSWSMFVCDVYVLWWTS